MSNNMSTEEMLAEAKRLTEEAERTKKHNKKLEKRFQRLKKMDEDTIETIAEKHGCMADLYLDSGGSEKKANKSLKAVKSVLKKDRQGEEAYKLEKAEMQAKIDELDAKIASLSK